ncbi:hypothetical protein [Streptomyces malaysiensis]|nr:hypothetical protein [Streptomyces malaysiensis]
MTPNAVRYAPGHGALTGERTATGGFVGSARRGVRDASGMGEV